tara:strand:- start:43 stop:219 length:177 start_codon:yes stop_codon:yes gene_type:complete
MINKINKGDLVKIVLGTMSGVVLRLDRWLPSGRVKYLVHFWDGTEMWVNFPQLEKLNK